MVKVVGFSKRISKEGREFNTLLLQGGIGVVKSKNGKTYISAHKVSLVCTLSEDECKQQIGSLLPGTIEKVACDPYEFTLQQTGEKVMLDYSFRYSPENASASIEEAAFAV